MLKNNSLENLLSLKKTLHLAIFLAVFLVFSNISLEQSFAQNPDLNETIVQEIENTLLFDAQENAEIVSYKKKTPKKSDININRGAKKSNAGNDKIKIKIVESKIKNLALRAKEKEAYNTSVVEQYEASIQLYKEVLLAEPKNSYAKLSLAIIYQKIGQLNQAKALYYEILKTNPNNKEDIIGNLLAILIEESPQDATYLLSRLAIQNPKSSYIVAQSALAYENVQDYEQAVTMIKKAILLDQNRLDYKYNLAVIYDKKGDYLKALDAYSDVVKAYEVSGSQLTSMEQVKQRMKSIKSIL